MPASRRAESQHAGATHQGYECGRAWVALRSAYATVMACLSEALGARFGLGVNDFEVLLLLGSAAPRRLRLGELHHAVDLSQPALSRLVDRLESQGLVTRSELADDRRGVLIEITKRGADVLRLAVPVHAACVRGGFIDRLSQEEQDALVAMLTRIQPKAGREIAKSLAPGAVRTNEPHS